MKEPTPLALITALACLALAPLAAAKDAPPPGAVRVDPSTVNVLSTGLAKLSPGVRPYVANFMLLWASTQGKNSETMKWTLVAPADGEYAVEALVHWQDIEEQLTKRGASYAVVVPEDAATIKADMLKLGAKLKQTALTHGDGNRLGITIPIERGLPKPAGTTD